MTLKGKDFSLAHPVAQSTKVTQLSTILGRYVPGGTYLGHFEGLQGRKRARQLYSDKAVIAVQ